MASKHKFINRDAIDGGVDRGIRPHLVDENKWVNSFNLRFRQQQRTQILRKHIELTAPAPASAVFNQTWLGSTPVISCASGTYNGDIYPGFPRTTTGIGGQIFYSRNIADQSPCSKATATVYIVFTTLDSDLRYVDDRLLVNGSAAVDYPASITAVHNITAYWNFSGMNLIQGMDVFGPPWYLSPWYIRFVV